MKHRKPITDAEIVKAAFAWVRTSMYPDNLVRPHEWHTAQFERQQRAEARLWRLLVDAYGQRKPRRAPRSGGGSR